MMIIKTYSAAASTAKQTAKDKADNNYDDNKVMLAPLSKKPFKIGDEGDEDDDHRIRSQDRWTPNDNNRDEQRLKYIILSDVFSL